MKFNYTAVDANNKTQKGFIDAPDLKTATKMLIEQGWFIKKIDSPSKIKGDIFNFSIGKISLMDKVLFAKHLSAMIQSGISLSESLTAISGQTISPKFKKVIDEISARTQTGQSLSRVLENYPKVFDPFFVNIIRVGEESGTLQENLEYLSNELEDQVDLRRKVKAASIYPSIILTATFALGLVLAYFVLPRITQLFSVLKFDLPLSTKILLGLADVFDRFGIYILAGFALLFIAFKIIIKLPPVKPYWHKFLMHIPIVAKIIVNYNLTIISRTMSTLLKSGLTIDQAMRVTGDVTQNLVYKKQLEKSLLNIQEGTQFSNVLSRFKQSKRNPIFPILTIKMIGIGERTGQLNESFDYLAKYYEKEVDGSTQSLTSVLEPILLLFVGGIVGFVAVSVISPIYQITGEFQG